MEIVSGIAVGTAAGVAAETANSIMNNEAGEHSVKHVITELCMSVHELHRYLAANLELMRTEEEVTVLTNLNTPTIIRRKGYQGIYILVATTSTFTVTVSGLGSFTWTPAVGSYNRWRFPEGTTIQLLTPSQNNYPINILYTNDTNNT